MPTEDIKDNVRLNRPIENKYHLVGIPYKDHPDGAVFTRRYFVVPMEQMSNEQVFKTLDEAISVIPQGLSHLRFRQILPLSCRLRGLLLFPYTVR